MIDFILYTPNQPIQLAEVVLRGCLLIVQSLKVFLSVEFSSLRIYKLRSHPYANEVEDILGTCGKSLKIYANNFSDFGA